MYRIVFWQNCISPHQMPFITKLKEDNRVDEVVVVVDEIVSEYRENMGWDTNKLTNTISCNIIISPDDFTIKKILSTREQDSIHLFSGINAYPFISSVLKESLKHKIKRGIITERPFTYKFGQSNGKPLLLHKIRFFLQDKKLAKHINYVFAIGSDAVTYFKNIHSKWTVFPFIYCTQKYIDNTLTQRKEKEQPSFVYVGSLSERKSPIDIIRAARKIPQIDLSIIGDGKQREHIQSLINKYKFRNINLLGTKNNSEILELIKNKDVFIMPSHYDGWGAVINEAISAGLYIICSDQCQAKELIDKTRGLIYQAKDIKQLESCIKKCYENYSQIRMTKQDRINWAHQNIDGEIIAQYFINCIDGLTPQAHWKK